MPDKVAFREGPLLGKDRIFSTLEIEPEVTWFIFTRLVVLAGLNAGNTQQTIKHKIVMILFLVSVAL